MKNIYLFLICLIAGIQNIFAQSPGGVSGATLWLKADNGTSTTIDGAGVNAWFDASGNANNMAQVIAGNQPVYRSNTTNNLNFNPALTFNGSTQFMDASTFAINGSSNTMFSVIKPAVVGGTWYDVLSWSNAAGNVGGELRLNSASQLEYLQVPFGSLNSAATTISPNTTFLFGSSVANNGVNGANLFLNNNTVGTGIVGTAPSTTLVSIGSRIVSGRNFFFDGAIPEIIVYNNLLTALQRQQVNSYLALKYGITLDQSTATNYIASDGVTKIWDATAAGAFNNNIFGIGRDDNSGLQQKVSASQSGRSIVSVALQNDFLSANNDATRTSTFAADNTFFTISDNSPLTGNPLWTASSAPAHTNLLNTQWQVQTNIAGGQSVYLQFDAGNTNFDVPAPVSGTTYYLVYDNSGTISASSSSIPLVNTSGSLWSTPSPVSFANGARFTVATAVGPLPGGVAGVNVWLKADAGAALATNTSSWTDQSINGFIFSKINASGPDGVSNTINFNPSLTFNGGTTGNTNILVNHSVPISTVVNTGSSQFIVYKQTAALVGGETYYTHINASQYLAAWDLAAGPVSMLAVNQGWAYPSPANAVNTPYLADATVTPGAPTGVTGLNGKLLSSGPSNSNVTSPSGTSFYIGGAGDAVVGSAPKASISEIIIYNTNETANRNKIESYLALKYGISLDQAAPTDYMASDGTTKMWDAAAAGPFNSNIFGLGRDDNSGLLQKVSASQNARGILTMALDNDFASDNNAASRTSTFPTDKNFFTVSNNAAAPGNPAWNLSSAPAGKALLESQWKVQTNISGGQAVFLQFDVANSNYDVPSPLAGSTYYLVYDNGGSISPASTVVPLVNTSGNLWSTANAISLSNGARFTLATTSTPLIAGIIAPNQTICMGSVPLTPLAETTAAAGGCGTYTYSWESSVDNGNNWTTVPGETFSSLTIGNAINLQTLYRRTVKDACGMQAVSIPDTIFISPAQGDPTVFGNGAWNVYAFDVSGNAFSSAIYKGYYTEPSLSFSSVSRWDPSTAPSNASGYQGCPVNPENHWVSYRRTNFTPGTYQLDIPIHDGAVYVFINGIQVFTDPSSGATNTNIWTGQLGATDKVEFLWRELGGLSEGALNVIPRLTPGTVGPNQYVCKGSVPATMLNETTAPTGPCAVSGYQWEISTDYGVNWTSITGATAKSYTITNAISGITLYRRVVTDACNNTAASLPDTVYINPLPVLIKSADTLVCPGKPATISASAAGSTLLWTDLGTNNSYVVNPAASTSYTVTATDANGCKSSATINVTVDVIKATLTPNPNPVKAANYLILAAGGAPNFSVLAWKPAATFNNQTADIQTVMILDTSFYSVVIKSQNGCIDTAFLKVIPEPNDKDFFVPNAFTPNGDGKNDIFKAYGRSIKEIELRVFNQWGQLLFETKDPAAGWNGVYKNVLQPAGPYIYTAHGKLYSGKEFNKKSTFNLVR